jgi:hypothetical protein
VDVDVRVVHVDVPAERAADEREGRREIQQLEERLVVGDRAEEVKGAIVGKPAGIVLALVEPVYRLDEGLERRRGQRIHDHNQTLLVELMVSAVYHGTEYVARDRRGPDWNRRRTGGVMRTVRLIALAAAIGATVWLLAAGANEGTTAARAAGCAATAVHHQPTKNPGLSELPWVQARPDRAFVMGLLLSYSQTLRDARVSRSDGLVLWMRGEKILWKAVGSSIGGTAVARQVGARRSFKIPLRSTSRGVVSALRFPAAGCWRLTLRTRRGAASAVALVVPRPATLGCDATPVGPTGLAGVRPTTAGIAGLWTWFTSANEALIYTHGVAPKEVPTKVPWWIRHGWGARLHLTGIRLDTRGQFRQAFWQAGEAGTRPEGYRAMFPSIVKVPSAGCWLFTLRTGRVAGILVVRAVDL